MERCCYCEKKAITKCGSCRKPLCARCRMKENELSYCNQDCAKVS